ncbi:hypothetical protein [Streptomyces mobaraensis]|uniref:hypothetical protein n=1 Tax=Streptomyces mobaraensis TaxID=35621 RepID=UPI0012ACBF5C|nr:hypothetical protein [Streptomyces mobaraensis]
MTKPYVYGESKLKTRPVVDSPRPPVKKLDLVITSIQDVQDMLTGDMPETAGEAAA